MSEQWYRKLGYSANPFSIKPAPFSDEVIGYSLSWMFKKIEDGSLVYITGPFGTGKTTVLKHVIRQYGGQRRVIYFSCSLERRMNPDSLARGAGGMLSRLLGQYPRDLIFLVDEAQDLEPKDAAALYALYKQRVVKSIVFVGTELSKKNYPLEMRKLLELNLKHMESLSTQEAVALVMHRLGETDIMDMSVIKDLYERSGHNIRMLLELCEDLARKSVAKGVTKMTRRELHLLPELPRKKHVRKKSKRAKKKQAYELAIEEAVAESEAESPVVETLHSIGASEPLPAHKR